MIRKITLSVLIIIGILFGAAFSIGLPYAAVPKSSTVYDVNGQVVQGLSEQNQVQVQIDQMSPHFVNAIIAVEDKDFYHHHGVDIRGMARAMLVNIKSGEIVAGGSTITQQTAKTLFLSNERTWSRKIKELYYSILMENRYSKEEILTMYCNSIYFGQGAYGVELASRTYFAKKAIDLTLAQSALLAGLPQSPSYYDPYLRPEEAKNRQGQVLQRMVEEGMITAAEKDAAANEKLTYKRAQFAASDAPYFVAAVRDYLRDKYGDSMVYRGGLRVYTTLDLSMQRAANEAYLNGLKNQNANLQVALVALDVKTGQIRAMVGGRDYTGSSYNRAYSQRQPGSTFKPFVYSLAMEKGFNPASMIMCEEKEYKLPNGDTYKPKDYGDEPYHWRQFTLKEAVMISDNSVAVSLVDQLGVTEAANYAEQFGFQGIQSILSLPLGSNEVSPVDMAAGYSVLANQGVYNKPTYLLKVVNDDGVVLESSTMNPNRVISAENAFIITNMLTGVMEPGGTGSALKEQAGRITAGKTGTTEQKNDAWFVGYTPQLCCAVWVGYDQGKAANLFGGSAAGPIWASFIRNASVKLPPNDFVKPDQVDLLTVCLDTGLVAVEACPRKNTMAFLSTNQPGELCYLHQPLSNWFNDLFPDLGDGQETGRPWWRLWE